LLGVVDEDLGGLARRLARPWIALREAPRHRRARPHLVVEVAVEARALVEPGYHEPAV